MMNKIIYSLVYNRKKSLNKRGVALVQVEAYLNRKKKYFSTKVYLRPDQWDAKKLLVKNHPNADALNRLIYEFMAMIEKRELELWQQGKPITLEILKEMLSEQQEQEDKSSFIPFFKQEVMTSGLKESTKRNHLSTLALLQDFKKNVTFSDLTFEFVSSFEYFLQSKGYHTNTIAKHMKHLKRHINVAINKEYMDIQKYAFRKYKIKTVENGHTHLAPEELEKMETLQLTGRYIKYQKTLDAFLFCCYAGMRNLQDFFHLRDNSNVNKELIIITRLAGLSKKVSFHTARHTNATLLIYNGVNITTVQKLLGHKSVKTTQIYTNVMDMTIISDLEKNHSLAHRKKGK